MKLGKKTVVIFAVNLVLLIIFGILCGVYGKFAHTLDAQYAHERWRGENETPYAQISVFNSGAQAMNYGDVHSIREAVKSAMTEASLAPDENENLTRDAFSYIDTVSVTSARTKSAETTLYAVGGDYFVFHPLRLVSGEYIRERDLNDDLVVIDRTLAWTLFGAVDVAGMTLTVQGRDYIVAGVVERERDRFTSRADDAVSAIYMPYLALYGYDTANITSYETVLPNPVENFAVDIIKGAASGGEIVENSRRFELSRIKDLIFDFGKRAANSSGIELPPFETAARLCEDNLALVAALAAAALIIPAVCFVILIVTAYIALKKTGKRMANKIREKY